MTKRTVFLITIGLFLGGCGKKLSSSDGGGSATPEIKTCYEDLRDNLETSTQFFVNSADTAIDDGFPALNTTLAGKTYSNVYYDAGYDYIREKVSRAGIVYSNETVANWEYLNRAVEIGPTSGEFVLTYASAPTFNSAQVNFQRFTLSADCTLSLQSTHIMTMSASTTAGVTTMSLDKKDFTVGGSTVTSTETRTFSTSLVTFISVAQWTDAKLSAIDSSKYGFMFVPGSGGYRVTVTKFGNRPLTDPFKRAAKSGTQFLMTYSLGSAPSYFEKITLFSADEYALTTETSARFSVPRVVFAAVKLSL